MIARFYKLHSIYGRVEPLADVDLSPPKSAQVTVVYNENSSDDSDGYTSDPIQSIQSDSVKVKDIKINLNKSVKEFKLQLR